MIQLANLTREGFKSNDIASVMSPRTLIHWLENLSLCDDDLQYSFKLSFLNKCNEEDKEIIAEYFQRCFGEELV